MLYRSVCVEVFEGVSAYEEKVNFRVVLEDLLTSG